jgi:hypothetical protein
MNVNKYRLAFNPQAIELDFTIPVEQTWDFTGIDDGYQIYEQEAVKEVINFEDFETARITHKSYTLNPSQQNLTAINYQFFFRDINTPNGYVTSPSYLPKFTNKQIYYYQNQFVNSFWKLDLYDSPITQNQKNYITIILPVWQGAFQPSTIGIETVNIKTPDYRLDYVGDKEGFFIYWLKKKTFLDINTFYMTAKFFDGETGEFVRMVNQPQNTSAPNTFNQEDFFYYKVLFESDTPKGEPKLYYVESYPAGGRVGENGNPIKWYEYQNP